MINPHWLELPMSRVNFHGPKDAQAIEVRLYKLFKFDVYFALAWLLRILGPMKFSKLPIKFSKGTSEV